MKALRVDFGNARKPAAWYLGCLGLVAGLSVVGYDAWLYAKHVRAYDVLRADQGRLQTQLRELDGPRPSASGTLPQEAMEHLARATDRIHTPWSELFQDVESVMDEQVGLLSLEPDAVAGVVRLRAEAKDLEAVFRFVQRFEKTAVLAQAHLDSYQMQLHDPQRPIRFTLISPWALPRAVETPRADGGVGAEKP